MFLSTSETLLYNHLILIFALLQISSTICQLINHGMDSDDIDRTLEKLKLQSTLEELQCSLNITVPNQEFLSCSVKRYLTEEFKGKQTYFMSLDCRQFYTENISIIPCHELNITRVCSIEFIAPTSISIPQLKKYDRFNCKDINFYYRLDGSFERTAVNILNIDLDFTEVNKLQLMELKNVRFKDTLNLKFKAIAVIREMYFINIKTTSISPVFDFVRPVRIYKLVFRDSWILNIRKNDFTFHGHHRQVLMINTSIETIEKGSIEYWCIWSNDPTSDSLKVEIQIPNSGLKPVVEPGFIKIYQCSGGRNIKLEFKSNLFPGYLPDDKFSNLFQDLSKYHMNIFYTDPIDCCSESNDWIFKFVHESKSYRVFQIDCLHMVGIYYVSTILDEKEREDICKNLKVSPVILIVIVSVLVLAICLAIISLIFYVYVLPKKKELSRHRKQPHRTKVRSGKSNKQLTKLDSPSHDSPLLISKGSTIVTKDSKLTDATTSNHPPLTSSMSRKTTHTSSPKLPSKPVTSPTSTTNLTNSKASQKTQMKAKNGDKFKSITSNSNLNKSLRSKLELGKSSSGIQQSDKKSPKSPQLTIRLSQIKMSDTSSIASREPPKSPRIKLDMRQLLSASASSKSIRTLKLPTLTSDSALKNTASAGSVKIIK